MTFLPSFLPPPHCSPILLHEVRRCCATCVIINGLRGVLCMPVYSRARAVSHCGGHQPVSGLLLSFKKCLFYFLQEKKMLSVLVADCCFDTLGNNTIFSMMQIRLESAINMRRYHVLRLCIPLQLDIESVLCFPGFKRLHHSKERSFFDLTSYHNPFNTCLHPRSHHIHITDDYSSGVSLC